MNLWAIDCHVHFYDGYDVDLAVRSAWKNVQSLDGPKPLGQCWCLASPPGTNGLDTLRSLAEQQLSNTRMVALRDSEGCNILVLERDEGPIVVVPGTQAISVEGLEVLSLGAELPAIRPTGLAAIVDRVKAIGGLPVVPWGVGKWLGRRGQLVSRLLQDAEAAHTLLLADNANRPWWWPFPVLLKKAAEDGLTIVSGSDPLPIQGDETRIGSAGVYCSVQSVETAWQQIRQSLLGSQGSSVRIYGKPMSTTRFWRNQILLRLSSVRS